MTDANDANEPACGCGDPDCGVCFNRCWYCHGDGWYIVGLDHDCDDGVNGPFDGECETCPCCHGSGLAKDETFW